MFPLGGKSFSPGEERCRAVQALGKRVAQEVNAERGRPVSEELRTIHGGSGEMVSSSVWHGCFLFCAIFRPNLCHPEDGNDQKGLKR